MLLLGFNSTEPAYTLSTRSPISTTMSRRCCGSFACLKWPIRMIKCQALPNEPNWEMLRPNSKRPATGHVSNREKQHARPNSSADWKLDVSSIYTTQELDSSEQVSFETMLEESRISPRASPERGRVQSSQPVKSQQPASIEPARFCICPTCTLYRCVEHQHDEAQRPESSMRNGSSSSRCYDGVGSASDLSRDLSCYVKAHVNHKCGCMAS